MRPEHRFTFSSNLIIYGDNMNKISDVKKVILSKLSSIYSRPVPFPLMGISSALTFFIIQPNDNGMSR